VSDERPHDYRRYKSYGCRCFPCRLDNARYNRDLAAGRGPRAVNYMPVAPVREHLRRLSARGVGYRRVADLAGVDQYTVRRWLYEEAELCRRALGEKILAVGDDATPRRWLDATGAQRRIQALGAMGWPLTQLARRAGWRRHRPAQILARAEVFPSTFADVSRAYTELWNEPPPPTGWVSRAQELARENKWFPPGAWDDETIDDPTALPCLLPPVEPVDRDLELLVQHVFAGHPVEATVEAKREIVRRMPDRKPREIAPIVRCTAREISYFRSTLEAS
jgi:hypothetical protein